MGLGDDRADAGRPTQARWDATRNDTTDAAGATETQIFPKGNVSRTREALLGSATNMGTRRMGAAATVSQVKFRRSYCGTKSRSAHCHESAVSACYIMVGGLQEDATSDDRKASGQESSR